MEEGEFGTIPVIAMRDVPRGDQGTGRREIMEITENARFRGRNVKLAGIFLYFSLFNLGLLAISVMKVSFKMVRAH